MRKIFFSRVHDLQPLKKAAVIFFSFFKEISENAHIQCFAESPGPGKKIDFSLHVQQFFYKQSLIYKIIAMLPQILKIFHADRQRYPFHTKRLPSRCSYILLRPKRRRKVLYITDFRMLLLTLTKDSSSPIRQAVLHTQRPESELRIRPLAVPRQFPRPAP